MVPHLGAISKSGGYYHYIDGYRDVGTKKGPLGPSLKRALSKQQIGNFSVSKFVTELYKYYFIKLPQLDFSKRQTALYPTQGHSFIIGVLV